MYHPSRGGVRGGRDQFNWDDVKGDKHRENYLGHSLKAPVGRWQKGKDLMWYTRDGKQTADEAAVSAREEIERVKQEEEEAMREALGLAPQRGNKPRVNRLDKREQEELLKRSKVGEEVEKPYAQGERVQGIGFAPVTKTLAPDKKDLLQREAAPEEERPLAPVISPVHIGEAERTGQETVTDAVKEDSRQVSDDLDKKRKRKEEKKAAKEQRREEKRTAKKMRREKRRRQISVSSDEELADKNVSGAKPQRRDSDSSDEDHGHASRRKDARSNTLGDKRNTTIHERDSSDDGAPRPSRRTRAESDEDMQNRPSTTRAAPGRRDETLGRDARNVYDDHSAERNGRRPHDRTGDERERKYGRVHDSSPRQTHGRDDRENHDRDGRYRGAYNREVANFRGRRDSDSDEEIRRRRKGGNDFRNQDEFSRGVDMHYSKDDRSHRRRSPSPVRRKPRRETD